MKIIIVILCLSSLLSGCVIDTNGCTQAIYGGWVCPSDFHGSEFHAYTKADENKAQKLKDMSDCGGTVDQYGNIFREQTQTNKENDSWTVKYFSQCMKRKGYDYYKD